MFQVIIYNQAGKVTGSSIANTLIEAIEAGEKNFVVVPLRAVYVQYDGEEVDELPMPKKKRKAKYKGENRPTVKSLVLRDEMARFFRGDDVEDDAREMIEALVNDRLPLIRGKGRVRNEKATMKGRKGFDGQLEERIKRAKDGMADFSREKAKEYEENHDPRRRKQRRKQRRKRRQETRQGNPVTVKPIEEVKEPEKVKPKEPVKPTKRAEPSEKEKPEKQDKAKGPKKEKG